jgi:hypothetical protein
MLWPRWLRRWIAGDAHLRFVKLVEPQPSWVRVLACFKIRASTTFGRLAPCSRSPCALALLAPAAGRGHTVLQASSHVGRGRSALASRCPGPRCCARRWPLGRAQGCAKAAAAAAWPSWRSLHHSIHYHVASLDVCHCCHAWSLT